MDLLSENAKAACLLKSFIAYAQSDEFKPTGQFEIRSALGVQSNGLGKILQRPAWSDTNCFGPREISVTRSGETAEPLVWETTKPPKLKPDDSWKWLVWWGWERWTRSP